MKKNKNSAKQVQKYTEFVYGVHPVLELLQAKRRKIGAIYTLNHPIKAWSQIKSLIPDYIQVSLVTRDALTNMAGTSDHQGVLAYVSAFPFAKNMFDPVKQPFVLVLDGIQDVGNVGAIMRSAYCTGVDGIILTQKGCAPLNAAAVKASAGLAEHCNVFIAPTIGFAVQELQKSGYSLYLATLGKGENAANMTFKQPTALVIGNEEAGISSAILKTGTRVLLPQRRVDISYNASVAAGILLFLIGVQLKKI